MDTRKCFLFFLFVFFVFCGVFSSPSVTLKMESRSRKQINPVTYQQKLVKIHIFVLLKENLRSKSSCDLEFKLRVTKTASTLCFFTPELGKKYPSTGSRDHSKTCELIMGSKSPISTYSALCLAPIIYPCKFGENPSTASSDIAHTRNYCPKGISLPVYLKFIICFGRYLAHKTL